MPPVPMVPHQGHFQQQSERGMGSHSVGGQHLGRGGDEADVAGVLPGAPEPSPPLHTHSSKFPIEREVIVSSAEKTSDTFKAKIPLIQDYGKRLVGVVGGGGGGGGGVVGSVRGGVGTSAVAPDAPVKQMAWAEAAGKPTGRKVTPSVSQHLVHHKPPANTHVHGGIYGQHFQNQDIQNRQIRDTMTSHHYNGRQQIGAVPRRDWSNSPMADVPGQRSHGEYTQPHQQSARPVDSGRQWSSPSAMQSGAYGSVQCSSGPPKTDSALEDTKGECAIANTGACHRVDEVEADLQQMSRTDIDVEAGNATADDDKCDGEKVSMQQQQQASSSKASRTYHHIKDMISSRFGGRVAREGGAGDGGEVPADATAPARGAGKEGGRQQGLNNSGCRSIPNEASSPMPCIPLQQQQPSNRKSNNLGEHDEVFQHKMDATGGHYQQSTQQFRKTDNSSGGNRSELGLGNKEQCVDEPRGAVRRDPVHQNGYQWAGSPASDDYGQMRRNVSRDGAEAGLGRRLDAGELGGGQMQKEEDKSRREDSVLRAQSVSLEFSMASMEIGEPAFYSTPVGEQGKQNNAKFASKSGDGEQNVKQLHGPGSPSQGNPNHQPNQGFINSNLGRLSGGGGGVGEKGEGSRGGAELSGATTRGGGSSRAGEGSGGREEVMTDAAGGGSMGGGSSDYEKATHRSGRSTSTDSGRGTAGHGATGSRKGARLEGRGSCGAGLDDSDGTRLDGVASTTIYHHPGSRGALYSHGGQRSVHDTEWVDVVESELQQILDPKLHSMDGGYGMAMSGIANSVVSESMSMTPPLPPLSPGGSPPSSPLCARKDRGRHYKLSSSVPYINKASGQMECKIQGSSGRAVLAHSIQHMVGGSSGGASSRLHQAVSHPSGISMSVASGRGGRQQPGRGAVVSMEGAGSRGGGWGGSGRGSSSPRSRGPAPGFAERGRTPMRKDQTYHGGPSNSVKAMLGNAIPLASFGAPPGFDNGDMTSTTTGLDLDSMLDGPTENTSEEDMSATIDTTDAHAIRKQLEGLENMYSEVLKLLGVKKHGSRYQPSDPRINKRRMYGSLSSLPSSASSRPVRDKRRHEDRKKVKDIKGINKRFQRLESHVVTLARSVAHLSSEMRTQHLMMQEIETMRGEIAQLRARPMRSPSVPWLTAKAPIEKDSFCNNVPALTNPDRVKKLTKFFGDEPPLLRIFLKKLGYEKYASAFEHERIGLVELPYLTEERLQKMGIPMGPRLRILQEAQLSFCQENMSVYVV